ncbi:MAG: BON domain-containing protein [Acidobacteriaceae bacterium]|nr:BON domain-containing protein [Acidobacteriaceae bacterium]MBV9293930.1 BON domain-containing protein [Acidobacteriaceae bacterium]MBV9763426.1 BON domain-containing protein [Acidobacteriaceae bacterium]
MKQKLICAFSSLVLTVCVGCSNSDRDRAREKASEAKQKTREEARKLTQEVKQDVHALNQKINGALENHPVKSNDAGEARQKLKRGAEDLRVAGGQATVKLDHAATIARVKAKLATDMGLSTVTNVDVDASGQVVTLRGTVVSAEQKQEAERAALEVSGVTRVINNLQVQP